MAKNSTRCWSCRRDSTRRSQGAGLVLALLIMEALLALSVVAQPKQRVHREGFEPVGDELFGLVQEFYLYDVGFPLDARVLESWTEEGTRAGSEFVAGYEKVAFTTSTGERVPMVLALPTTDDDQVPVVLLLHGLGNDRQRWWEEDRVALPEALLEAGIGVAAFDLHLHGERSSLNDYQSPIYLTFGNDYVIRSRNMLIQSTIDARRALDYLSNRPEIDPSRLAVAGYSMGGMVSLYLGALEPRLAAVVASAVPTTEQPMPVDPFHFAPRSTVPTLLQIGRDDWLSSPSDAQRLRTLLRSEDAALRFFDAGHRLPPAFALSASDWLIEKLGVTRSSDG